jgi:hypothetical protein
MADYLAPDNQAADLRQMQEQIVCRAEEVLGSRDRNTPWDRQSSTLLTHLFG